MPQFTDKKGRIWDLDLDLLGCERIDSSDFKRYFKDDWSILSLEPAVIRDLVSKSSFTFAVIWALVQPQAKLKFQELETWKKRPLSNQSGPNSERQTAAEQSPPDSFPIDPEADPEAAQSEFVSGINAKAKVEGQQAFLEALSDFFPELKTALSASARQLRNLSVTYEEKIGQLEPEFQKMLSEEMDQGIAEIKKRLLKTRDGRLGEISSSLPR